MYHQTREREIDVPFSFDKCAYFVFNSCAPVQSKSKIDKCVMERTKTTLSFCHINLLCFDFRPDLRPYVVTFVLLPPSFPSRSNLLTDWRTSQQQTLLSYCLHCYVRNQTANVYVYRTPSLVSWWFDAIALIVLYKHTIHTHTHEVTRQTRQLCVYHWDVAISNLMVPNGCLPCNNRIIYVFRCEREMFYDLEQYCVPHAMQTPHTNVGQRSEAQVIIQCHPQM